MITSRDDAIAQLAWIAPDADSLVALTSAPSPWTSVRDDPGAVFLLARQRASELASKHSYCLRRLQSAQLFEQAIALVDRPGFAAWHEPNLLPIYRTAWRIAALSCKTAETLGQGDPDEAWTAGMMAPLGWLALAAIEHGRIVDCHDNGADRPGRDPCREDDNSFDPAALARRVLRLWEVPTRLAVAGHLGLPVDTAVALGAEPLLFQVVQFAIELLRGHDDLLGLRSGTTKTESSAILKLSSDQLDRLEADARDLSTRQPPLRSWQCPSKRPLLRELLSLAAENRRLLRTNPILELEERVDKLHGTVARQHATFARRLEESKLSAIAEFAAGAGHEINNPLAVISGQAQYLLRTVEEDSSGHRLPQDTGATPPAESSAQPSAEQTVLRLAPARFRDCLQKSIQQTQRIHDVLRQLMLFARPPRPHPQDVDLVTLVHEVLTAHGELAAERKVRLTGPEHGESLTVRADLIQLRTAVACLVKNAIEAAGSGGWAQVRLHTNVHEEAELVVEDSGPGPERHQRDHLFEPFYSGREAGRGRGLGLPIAWRLAREQGGAVEFVPLPEGPTRFVLTVPARPTDEPGVSPMRPPTNGVLRIAARS